MPHPIFQIDELLRLVIDAVVETSPRAAVSFALTCRSLEEPTLSSLWKHQHSLCNLLKVMPSFTLFRRGYHRYAEIDDDLSAEDWVRLQRYASWMFKLDLSYDFPFSHKCSEAQPTTETLSLLSSNSPDGILFPKLESLIWRVTHMYTPLHSVPLFLSPRLRNVTLYTYPNLDEVLNGTIATLEQAISFLPSSLEQLSVLYGRGKEEPLQNTISSLVLRYGSSLRSFEACVPLSEAATLHLMQLPNLSHWSTSQGPPKIAPASTFPSLEKICLNSPEALPWIHFLASHEQSASRKNTPSATQPTNVRDRLKCLEYTEDIIVDSRLLPSIAKFRNLVILCTHTDCFPREDCIFHLVDDDVESLATTLPHLKTLQLGFPCHSKTCKTTITSLMSISVNCSDLKDLEIHFDTKTIVGDMQRLLDGGTGREKPKCKLQSLTVGKLALELRLEDVETVARGFRFIFPSLRIFISSPLGSDLCSWQQLQLEL